MKKPGGSAHVHHGLLTVGAVVIVVMMATWALGARVESSTALAATPGAIAEATSLSQEHAYVGPRDGCRKCHLREYRSWEDTPHASALSVLEGEDATNSECIQCHTTGYGTETGFVSIDETPELANVTCEACHGAGADYRDRETMKDREASIAAGLNIPTEETCRGCHNSNSPTFSGEFDFESMKEKGVHEIKR